jgi:YD repeat-containing protein
MRRLTLYFIALSLLSAGIAGCAGKGGQKGDQSVVEYYRGLQFSETPYDLERGSHQLTEAESKTVNNYRFTYDGQGRLLSVEFMRGDSLLAYSSMGGAAKIVYEYSDNRQVKSFYNKKSERIESSGVYSAEYTLDEQWRERTGLSNFSEKRDSQLRTGTAFTPMSGVYFPDGMVRELRYNLAGVETVMNPFCPFFELRFTYNDKGYLTRMANYMADTLYNCTAENCGDIGVSYFLFEPNEFGDIESFAVFNVTGQMSNLYSGWSKRISKYDGNGYPVEIAYFDQDDEYLSGNRVPVTQYVYDDHGSVLEIRNMDKDRNVINNPETGVAITAYKYDEIGNRIETLRYDRDRNPVAL